MPALASFSLDKLTALVIGGTSGIGQAIAQGLARSGARVAIVGRNPGKMQTALTELRRHDPAARGYLHDVADNAQAEAMFGQVISDHGAIDILVPAQGMTILKAAEDFSEQDYDSIMAANSRSVFFCCTRAGAHMLGRKQGAIITIGSMSAHRGFPRSAIYAASKHAVIGLTLSLAAEWAGRGVRVNAISPGFFATDLTRAAMSPERRDSAIRRTPMGRFGELDELVGAAVYLASPAAKFVTGTVINVDGGYLAGGI